MNTIELKQPATPADMDLVRGIFREYEAWLGMDLCFQGFEDELKNLPGKYDPPEGRLHLAYTDGELAGCIAMRSLGGGVCEMKRLFVRDKYRGRQIGRILIERLISDAREIGYDQMRLDTYPPKMGKAVQLYESYGFREIPAYYHNPTEGVLFMELDL
jgi:GNAT superfamily N-acetyltransferase